MTQHLDALTTQPGLSAVGWQFEPTMTQEQWIEQGRHLARLETARQWILGDWWNAGVQWGEGEAVCEELGIKYQYAADCGWVAATLPFSLRKEILTFSHHKEVCTIDDPLVQDRFLAWALEPVDSTGKPRSIRALRQAVAEYLDAQSWPESERQRRALVEAGHATLAHCKADTHLMRWGEFADRVVRIDRTTKWGNPFEVEKDGDRSYVIESFGEHYLPRKPSLLEALPELQGKILACWCFPQRCHGEVLLEAIDRLGYERLMELRPAQEPHNAD